jgi:Domain of unknown function (DUF4440)
MDRLAIKVGARRNSMANVEDEIRATENKRIRALIDVDMETLQSLFSDRLAHIHSNAIVHSKDELLSYVEQRRAFIAIERGPLNIDVCGDMAVMTGRMTSRMRSEDGEVTLSGMVTQVLCLEAGVWRYINFQFTKG